MMAAPIQFLRRTTSQMFMNAVLLAPALR